MTTIQGALPLGWLAVESRAVSSTDETDEYSYNIVDANGQKTTRFEDDAVHINDLNATILHQLGIDHRRFTSPIKASTND